MFPLSDLTQEAMRIIELAENRRIILRVMGACAVRLHCHRYACLFDKLERVLTDVDFMSYRQFEPRMEEFFRELGYALRSCIMKTLTLGRHIYNSGERGITVDVFFDRLEMCHGIDFRGRLELDYPSITLADILLEKMQILKLTEKDVKDVIVLLREHSVGETDNETINVKYIAKLLSGDWGFYYTITTNLNKVKGLLHRFEVLAKKDRVDIARKIDRMLQAIDYEPKSLKWKLRAKVGTRMKWYTEVEDLPASA